MLKEGNVNTWRDMIERWGMWAITGAMILVWCFVLWGCQSASNIRVELPPGVVVEAGQQVVPVQVLINNKTIEVGREATVPIGALP
jgi:hypothetical protein